MALDDFIGDDSSTDDNKTGSGNFDRFTRNEFEEAFDTLDQFMIRKDYEWTDEWVYESRDKEYPVSIRVYSSVDKHSNIARPKGEDAIRVQVVLTEDGSTLTSEKRVNRTECWQSRMRSRIRKLAAKYDDLKRCTECGSYMAVRESGRTGDLFYGCTQYPDCENTANY